MSIALALIFVAAGLVLVTALAAPRLATTLQLMQAMLCGGTTLYTLVYGPFSDPWLQVEWLSARGVNLVYLPRIDFWGGATLTAILLSSLGEVLLLRADRQRTSWPMGRLLAAQLLVPPLLADSTTPTAGYVVWLVGFAMAANIVDCLAGFAMTDAEQPRWARWLVGQTLGNLLVLAAVLLPLALPTASAKWTTELPFGWFLVPTLVSLIGGLGIVLKGLHLVMPTSLSVLPALNAPGPSNALVSSPLVTINPLLVLAVMGYRLWPQWITPATMGGMHLLAGLLIARALWPTASPWTIWASQLRAEESIPPYREQGNGFALTAINFLMLLTARHPVATGLALSLVAGAWLQHVLQLVAASLVPRQTRLARALVACGQTVVAAIIMLEMEFWLSWSQVMSPWARGFLITATAMTALTQWMGERCVVQQWTHAPLAESERVSQHRLPWLSSLMPLAALGLLSATPWFVPPESLAGPLLTFLVGPKDPLALCLTAGVYLLSLLLARWWTRGTVDDRVLLPSAGFLSFLGEISRGIDESVWAHFFQLERSFLRGTSRRLGRRLDELGELALPTAFLCLGLLAILTLVLFP